MPNFYPMDVGPEGSHWHFRKILKKNGPSGNRTRVLGFEAQEDILYPMDPSHLLYIKRY